MKPPSKSVSTTPKVPPPPRHLGKVAAGFWRAVMAGFFLDDHQVELLLVACEARDRAERCRVEIEVSGATFPDAKGNPKVHPLVAAERDARQAFIQAYKSLGLDVQPAGPVGHPPGRH